MPMNTPHRRSFIVALVASASSGAALAQSGLDATPLSKLKRNARTACLYHCDFGDRARFVQLCTNLGNHFDVYSNPKDIELVVVVHSQGVKYFVENKAGTPWENEPELDATFALLEPLAARGLKVYLCEITFKRLKLDKANARRRPWIIFVPSGVATVADLQTKGFAYLKVG
ncbi:MAG: DsrE family protein [Beijerinckiaceae bacterium]|nr:DsrE family protein [Beijerinckiaceae bacterium]